MFAGTWFVQLNLKNNQGLFKDKFLIFKDNINTDDINI